MRERSHPLSDSCIQQFGSQHSAIIARRVKWHDHRSLPRYSVLDRDETTLPSVVTTYASVSQTFNICDPIFNHYFPPPIHKQQ
ncbi:hypothetical protein TNCV_3809841 [Trichonephila clavipes]|nr:hypothetical protein TNCV_3809841 [Trichonephila clavipes]